MPLVALSPALAPLLGAGLEEYFGWRSIFVVLVVIGLALSFATMLSKNLIRMFSQQDLQVIDAVARRGSFTAAAEELCKVPSAISYTVRNIEQRLAVDLFVRLHRKVKLTPAGEYFVTESRKLLKQMAHMKFQTCS